MKYKLIGFLLVVFISAGVTAEAQLYSPFASFRVIKTEYFDIIFSKESEPSAHLLATYADSLYEEISSLYEIKLRGRLPVTFAPHTDMFNGYYGFIPIPHIVLFDTPMDLEWTTFEDNLKGLFIHELVHAITMNTRSPFSKFLHFIFGNWATPALINAPLFMVEGAAISMESLAGFGRVNDPYTKHKLRQAIYEDKFLTPLQVSGLYDSPGQGGIWYEYGGLFSAWLQQKYGMEKYTELWRHMGRSSNFSFSVYKSDFYRTFNRVYEINFIDEWNAFKNSLVLNDIQKASGEILPAQYRFLTKNRNTISALAPGNSEIFILDRTEEKINVYNTQTENVRTFNTSSVYSYDLGISECGKTLLVSGYSVFGNRFKAVVIEHNTDTGRKTGRSIQGLYKARYFRDGVVGINSELHNNSIVFCDFNGNTEILFKGTEELMFSGPQVIDDEKIVFIAARNGVHELLIFNYISKELFRIECAAADNEYLQYIRSLSVTDGKLFFSHNVNDRMYKLAYIDLDTKQAVFNDSDFSGGVFNPVSINGNIYYRANFFSGDSVLRFPEPADSISGTQVAVSFVEQTTENTNTQPQTINLPPIVTSKPYFGLSYMNPFRFWLPLPLIRINENFEFSVDGGGIMSIMSDPTGRNMVSVIAFADMFYQMASISDFSWQTTIPGFPMTFDFSDYVSFDLYNEPFRSTRAGLSASILHIPGRWMYGISLGAGYVSSAYADDDSSTSAYEWSNKANRLYYHTAFQLSSNMRRGHELFGKGLSLNIRGMNIVGDFSPRFEGMFKVSKERRFPLGLTLYGAYDDQGMDIHGFSNTYSGPLFRRNASLEYKHPTGLNLTWLAGTELSLGVFSLEIQRNISHLYFNRFFGTLSVRNLLYDSQGFSEAEGIKAGHLHLAQSLVLKLGLIPSVLPLKISPIPFELNSWGAWKFSNTITGEGSPFSLGFGFNIMM